MRRARPGRFASGAGATVVSLFAAAIMFAIGASNAHAQRGGHGFSGHITAGRSWAARPSVSAFPPSTFPGLGVFGNPPLNTGGFNRGFRNGIVGVSRGGRGFERRRYIPFAAFLEPYFYPPFVDYGFGGFDWDDNGAYYDNSGYPPEPDSDTAALADQVQRLTAEMDYMRAAQAGARPSPYTPPSAYAPPSPYAPASPYAPPAYVPPSYTQQEEEPGQPAQPAVTLVLRDGQQLQVNNYAVMNQTFWDFSRQPVRKIPLSSIDIAASQKATEADGGEFPAISQQ